MRDAGAESLQPSWEEFLASARFLEEDGIYVANGDETFRNVEELRAYYDARAQPWEIGTRRAPLLLDLTDNGGGPNVWSPSQKRQLTYCVKNDSPHYAALVQGMNDAARKWEEAADVDFIHLSQFDSSCTVSQTGVLFRVDIHEDADPCEPSATGDMTSDWMEDPNGGGTCRPVARFVARGFFPDYAPNLRVIKVNTYFLTGTIADHDAATRSLLHELGHVLGFRHEHIRITTSNDCPKEDGGVNALTDYDPHSVMNYGGSCGGYRNRFGLSSLDRQGVRNVYGQSPLMGPETLLWIVNGP